MGALSFVLPLGALVRGQLRAVRLAPDDAGDRSGRRRLVHARTSWSSATAFARENARPRRGTRRPPARRARQPGLPAGAARGGCARSCTGFTTPPRPPRRAVAAPEPAGTASRSSSGASCSRRCIGVPLGHPVRHVAVVARLTEPFIEFFRYLPAPAFGALAVAVLGIDDAPKIAIIFIGTFFQQVLVVANTTRRLDPALLEAAQTLGAKRAPAALARRRAGHHHRPLHRHARAARLGLDVPDRRRADRRQLAASRTSSTSRRKYRDYENVFASIILIGLIGLGTDLVLASLGRQLFPWLRDGARAAGSRGAAAFGAAARAPRPTRAAAAAARERRRWQSATRTTTLELPTTASRRPRSRRASRAAEAAAGDPGGAAAWSKTFDAPTAARRRALDDVSFQRAPARVHVRDRPVGLRQVDAGAHPRRARRRRPAGEVLLDGKPVHGPGPGPRHGLPGLHAVPLAARCSKNVMFGLEMRGERPAPTAEERGARVARAGRPAQVRRRLPAPALGRHEAAGGDRARAAPTGRASC